MQQPEVYPSPTEIYPLLDELLVAMAATCLAVSAELERRGMTVKRPAELETRLRQFERKGMSQDDRRNLTKAET